MNEIKRLSIDEIKKLLNDSDSLFSPPLLSEVSLDDYSKKLAENAWFCINSNEDIRGAIAFYKNDKIQQIFITHIAVMPTYQNKGIATSMIKYLINKFSQYETLALEVRIQNTPALNLYKKNGFKIAKEQGEKYLMVR